MSNGQDEGSGAGIDFSTARGRDYPSVRQFNVFVENRVGNLLAVVRRFEATDIRIVSLTIVDSADCAIIRMVLSDPERAKEIFELAGLPCTESDLLVVGVEHQVEGGVSVGEPLAAQGFGFGGRGAARRVVHGACSGGTAVGKTAAVL